MTATCVANEKTLSELEFDQIRVEISQFASSELGRNAVLALVPLSDRAAIEGELEAVDEARLLLAERPGLKIPCALDRAFVSRVSKEGAILESEILIALRDAYRTIGDLHEVADDLIGRYPRVLGAASSLPYHRELHEALERVFDDRGEISDGATPELKELRRRQRTLARRIEHGLERLLRDPDRNRYLAEDFYTQLSDRYVVLVKFDFKGKIPGIVQGESASGLSLYIEPIEVVEANNEAIEARVEEAREIRRILRGLTEQAHAHSDEFPAMLDTLAWLDCCFAKALYARSIDACVPRFATDLTLSASRARHPLLGSRCVPIDLALQGGDRVLVVSGVNSGGKTVALKTVGLLVLMAQSGIPVAAGPDTTLPLVDRVASEIGDQQSIAQNLSSFSSHVTHVAEILGALGETSLLLFDEFMTGTDPEEGSALAEAVLAELSRRNALTLVTTHYGPLKLLAKKHPGFVNAAVEFDWDRLAPTFRLLSGVPGSSLGLDIALRFGLAAPLVDDARGLVDSGKGALAELIRDLEDQLTKVEAERRDLAALMELSEKERLEGKARLESLEKARAEELEAIKTAQIEEMEGFKARVHQALREGPAPQLPAEIHQRIVRKEQELEAARPPPPGDLAPGDWVRIANVKDAGMIVEVRKERNRAVVLVAGVQVKTSLSSLARTDPPPRPPKQKAAGRTSVALEARDVGPEINLIAMRVEEALEQLATYLDAAVVRCHQQVRVVHGKGTGALRSAVERYLKGHPAVKGYRPGTFGEGESGVTIVTLK